MNVLSVGLGLLVLIQIDTSRLLEQLADEVASVLGLWSALLGPWFAFSEGVILSAVLIEHSFIAGNSRWVLDQSACLLQQG